MFAQTSIVRNLHANEEKVTIRGLNESVYSFKLKHRRL